MTIYLGAGRMSKLIVDSDLDMGAHNITLGAGQLVDGRDVGNNLVLNTPGDFDARPEMFNKVVSENLRHSDDVGDTDTNDTYEIKETITFTYGIKGTLRIKFDLRRSTGVTAYGKIQANDIDVGAVQSEAGAVLTTKSQDIAIDIAPGQTITLLTKCDGGTNAHQWEHFRIYYDNAATSTYNVAVAVTGAD